MRSWQRLQESKASAVRIDEMLSYPDPQPPPSEKWQAAAGGHHRPDAAGANGSISGGGGGDGGGGGNGRAPMLLQNEGAGSSKRTGGWFWQHSKSFASFITIGSHISAKRSAFTSLEGPAFAEEGTSTLNPSSDHDDLKRSDRGDLNRSDRDDLNRSNRDDLNRSDRDDLNQSCYDDLKRLRQLAKGSVELDGRWAWPAAVPLGASLGDRHGVTKGHDSDGAVESSNGSARMALTDVSLKLRPGELLGVCGTTGAGKTSLLACLLGELDDVTSYVHDVTGDSDCGPSTDDYEEEKEERVVVAGRTAFLGQQPWVAFGTLRENIIMAAAATLAEASVTNVTASNSHRGGVNSRRASREMPPSPAAAVTKGRGGVNHGASPAEAPVTSGCGGTEGEVLLYNSVVEACALTNDLLTLTAGEWVGGLRDVG